MSWKRVGRAAYNSALDLQTLIPAAGALVFVIDDFDQKVYDWANKQHPIFGSQATADAFSDWTRYSLVGESLLTAILTPSGENKKDWTIDKLKGYSVEAAGILAAAGTTQLLKTTIHRTRPNDGDNYSFPSGHTSMSFAGVALSNDNLNSIPMNNGLRRSLQAMNLLLAGGVAWARVESGEHYPSDILAGAAIGYFLSSFIHDAFLGLPEEDRFGCVIIPLKSGVMGGVSTRF